MKQRALTTDRDHLVAELDRLTSIIVIRAYGPTCVVCGRCAPRGVFDHPDEARRRRFVECGHVFGRTHHSTRWDIHWGGNCYPQCPLCNQYHNEDRGPYLGWYRRTFGPVRLVALEQRWRRQRKFTDPELLELAAYYRILVAGQLPLPLRVPWPRLAFDALEVLPQPFRARATVEGLKTQSSLEPRKGAPAKKITRRRKKVVANRVAGCKMRPVRQSEGLSVKTTAESEKAAREARQRPTKQVIPGN